MAQASDIIGFARILLNSVSGSSARLQDASAIVLCDRAIKAVVSDVLFPASRLTTTTVPNQQLYQIPEFYMIERVYLAGQPIVPTTLDTLEGTQTLLYDQTATGTPLTTGDGPQGGGQAQPQWSTQAPVSYPFVNNWGRPAPVAQPWFPGQRPRYYMRGGQMGFVPPPANAVTLTIDGVAIPPKILNLTDYVQTPDNFIEPIAWRMCSYVKFADDSDRSSDQRNYAAQMAEKTLRELRSWVRQYTGDDSGPKILTYRSAYRVGGARTGDYD